MLVITKEFREHFKTCQHDEGIKSLECLHLDLYYAMQLEFATLPPYLSALYTIDESTNFSSYYVIRSVVMEEMFHLTLATNVLIATGGTPRFNCKKFVPNFPTTLPNGEKWFEVGLLPYSKTALQTFLDIELPGDLADGKETIGMFYERIQKGLEYLCNELGEDVVFPNNGNTEQQVPARYYYGGGGIIEPVTGLDTANRAINAIIAQGEGKPTGSWDPDEPFPSCGTTGLLSGDHDLFNQERELSHYYRFNELFLGRRYIDGDTPNSSPTGPEIPIDYNEVYNMVPNPNSKMYEGHPELQKLNHHCNVIFTRLLNELNEAFNGEPDKLINAVKTMYELKYAAQALMRNPIPDDPNGYYAGPTWEYLD